MPSLFWATTSKLGALTTAMSSLNKMAEPNPDWVCLSAAWNLPCGLQTAPERVKA